MGILEKTDAGYSYTSDVANEQYLKDKWLIDESNYGLFKSHKRESETLFIDFERLLWNVRPDCLDKANISFAYSDNDKVYKPYLNHAIVTDPSWEALIKLSFLPTFPSGFYSKLM